MRKFDRNIGPRELTFIDCDHGGHNFHRFITYGKSRGNISTRSVVSRRKDRTKEEMNCARCRGRSCEGWEEEGEEGQGRPRGEETLVDEGRRANRVKNVYNVSRGNNVAYGISSCEIFSRISWRHATQGTPSLFAARMSLY